jgi:hypothetical protein
MRNEDEEWLDNYAAYVYYRTFDRISLIAPGLMSLARHVVTGTP